MALLVNEIFYSIQGESIHSGRPCVFVRLTGCNLRCSYCDTGYAYDKGSKMEIAAILDRVATYNCPLIEITGGEPLVQKETPDLIYCLLEKGYEVLMETNGSFDISIVDKRCIKIIDIKCPTSGESDKNDLNNLKKLDQKDQIKFVIGSRSDYEFAGKIIKLISSEFPGNQILFSPVSGKMAYAKLAKWILEDNLNVRLHLQLHKIIWPEIQKGV
ncbi:MAG: radical SAM protein [Deltaproteobacteria bacterium]|nr:radical SAM protein [Deltaproteobacteria bacterium]MBW2662699.1 radical SAM protein [Deltaproteobacteria bacterium]